MSFIARRYRLILLAGLTGLSLYFGSVAINQSHAATTSFAGLLATQSEYIECGEGYTPGEISRYTIAISPNFERTEEHQLMGEAATPKPRVLQGRGRWVSMYPEVGRYFALQTASLSGSGLVARQLNPADGCATTLTGQMAPGAKTGEETIAGFRAVVWQLDSPSVTATTWLAPELGCFPIQSRTHYKAVNGAQEQSILRTTSSIQSGDPGESWFAIPSGMEHRAPSEVLAAVHTQRQRAKGRSEQAISQYVANLRLDMAARDQQWEQRRYDGR